MKVQNAIAALVFLLMSVCAASMLLLNMYPTSEALWYFNVNFAVEARPVFELFDLLPYAGFAQNVTLLALCLFLCVVAVRQRSKIITCLTTHLALYLLAYAGYVSYLLKLSKPQSASITTTEIAQISAALDPGQQALFVLIALLICTCLCNHVQIVAGMVRR